MKKILSFFAAGLLALGLIGCSGDLHDSEAIDMSKLFLRGNMNDWGATPVEAGTGDYAGKYVVKFTAVTTETQFAIATNDASWTTAYRKTKENAADGDPCAAYTAAELDGKTVKNLYHGGGMSNATIETEVGTDYTVVIETDAGFIKVAIVKGEAPIDCYVASSNTVSKMELVAKNNYKYIIDSDADGKLAFSIFDGTNTWGIETAETDKNLTLSKNKSVSLTGLKANKKYAITFNITNKDAPVLKVVQDIFVCYVNGDITGGEFKKLDVLTETGYRAFTFTYDAANMTKWGGANGKANFIINDIDSWSGNTKLFADVACDLNGDYEVCGSDTNNNATIEGLEDGHIYTVLVDISDTEAIQVKVIEGPALFITGGMDSWGWTLPPLENDDDGAYYTFTSAQTDCAFKVKVRPNWDSDADCVWADATVGTTATPAGANAAVGGGGNGVVTANAGDKVYFWYDYDAGKWMAKLVAKS